MFELRPYQQTLKNNIYTAFQQHVNVIAVAPTGAGKTAILASIFNDYKSRPSVAMAHRQELVTQISCALAENGIYHKVVASKSVVAFCIQQHVKQFGKNFHHDSSPVAVASVQTINRRAKSIEQWCNSVELWAGDEAHHYTSENTFGAATKLFPRAHGLGVTATPMRCDKKPLGRIHSGLFDFLVNGPSPRDLINAGYLCEYRIFAPPQSIDLSAVDISPNTREYSPNQLRETAHSDKSTITGDIVETYMKRVPGKRAIAFLIDVEDAKRTADKFNAAGVPAFAVDAKTPDNIRQDAIERFKRGDYKVLCNVDLFGEGFDVPGVEVVFMGRPTQSFGLYSQQFGRMMRTAPDKTHGILFDHVGNVKRHGLPDREMHWTLGIDERGVAGKRDPNAIPMRTCSACFFAYEALSNTCPYCGHVEVPESRGAPQFIDGDLEEFSPELLAKLRGDVSSVLEGSALIPHGAQEYVERRLQRLWSERQNTVRELQNCIDYWAGIQTTVYDRSINECYRIFYHKFGVDTLTAQGMPRPEMNLLLSKIREEFV